jgi:hypothetical protein
MRFKVIPGFPDKCIDLIAFDLFKADPKSIN